MLLRILACLAPLAAVCAFAEPTNTFQHRGFTVDVSAVGAATNLPAIRAALKVQIDNVCVVGLPPETLKAFQALPLRVLPKEGWKAGTPGRYMGVRRGVEMVETFVRQGNKPVLLHEFMHHYHVALLPDGTRNADVLAHFKRAQALTAYDAKSHMMANPGEYFACTATTYLFGVTAQEPFRRAKVQEQQPDCHDYLKKLFGPEAGGYAGVLKTP